VTHETLDQISLAQHRLIAKKLVPCVSYIRSAVEAPRVRWQGATREHSRALRDRGATRPMDPCRLNPSGQTLFGSCRVAQSLRIAADTLLLRLLA
jgi:hypothetical protein